MASTSSNPNSEYAWYVDDSRIAIILNSSGEWANPDESITDGLRIHYHSKYTEVDELGDDLSTTCGVDTGLHQYILDYVKYRILEDLGDMERVVYFWKKYTDGIKKYPHRKSGRRGIRIGRL